MAKSNNIDFQNDVTLQNLQYIIHIYGGSDAGVGQ